MIIGILSLIPLGKILISVSNFSKGNFRGISGPQTQVYDIALILLVLGLLVCFSLRKIIKKQIRVPLALNYAISGFDGRITLEKIHIDKNAHIVAEK